MSERYRTGRALSPEAAAVWRTIVAPYMPRSGSFRILDLGAGTCRFLPVLTAFPGARVVCVEPSSDMLAIGAGNNVSGDALFVIGKGERLPLRSASCDLMWLSQSYHHVAERGTLALELRRAARPDAYVLIRNSFADRLEGAFPTLYHFFPGARQLSLSLPSVADTVRNFEAHGFELESETPVRQQTCGSLREFERRTRLRADSSLELLADEEFESGLRTLSEAAEREAQPEPVVETMILLAFRLGSTATMRHA